MIIDLTRRIKDGQPSYPGDSVTELCQTHFVNRDFYNNHYLKIGMHTGTHIDIPGHFADGAVTMADWPPEQFVGNGVWLDCSKTDSNGRVAYDPAHELLVKNDSIVICHTGWSSNFGAPDYFSRYPVLADEYAELFVDRKIKMLCVDTPSPDKFPFPIHKTLFAHSILIAENLCNTAVLQQYAHFEIIALPLKIAAAGSIARIIARVE